FSAAITACSAVSALAVAPPSIIIPVTNPKVMLLVFISDLQNELSELERSATVPLRLHRRKPPHPALLAIARIVRRSPTSALARSPGGPGPPRRTRALGYRADGILVGALVKKRVTGRTAGTGPGADVALANRKIHKAELQPSSYRSLL